MATGTSRAAAPAYVDTGAFIAFLDKSDTHHPLFVGLFAEPPRLVTSALVIAEGHGWFLRRYDTTRALQFLAFVDDLAPLEITDVGSDLLSEGTRLLRRFADQTLTLADACGLALMKRRRIKTCWATDRHLALTGATLVVNA